MEKSVYFIDSEKGKKSLVEIRKELQKADVIVFKGGKRTKGVNKQEKLVIKMNKPIWYRPKPGFLNQRF